MRASQPLSDWYYWLDGMLWLAASCKFTYNIVHVQYYVNEVCKTCASVAALVAGFIAVVKGVLQRAFVCLTGSRKCNIKISIPRETAPVRMSLVARRANDCVRHGDWQQCDCRTISNLAINRTAKSIIPCNTSRTVAKRCSKCRFGSRFARNNKTGCCEQNSPQSDTYSRFGIKSRRTVFDVVPNKTYTTAKFD